MEYLVGFEFISAGSQPQSVRLTRLGELVVHACVDSWVGMNLLIAGGKGIEFEKKGDLVIEGQGLGRPYWNDERPTWMQGFDPLFEAQRILEIRKAIQRELNRAQLSVS